MEIEDRRAGQILEVIRALYEVNKLVPIIVEGKRDRRALRSLGITGEVILLHGGKTIYEFCEDILKQHERFILLLDWDERGEALQKSLSSHLQGHYEEFSLLRNRLKSLCQTDIKEIENLPALLRRLTGKPVESPVCPP
ncbi:hypothetical protein MNBD_NITROSPIRAE02-1669 [hydrothermal vent metagenome]|uniref:Toprim domain-containing protein n=1 Tax=hydrothermal vent metagenome TaxID=652676 RepID=A0A3B1DAG8_9ZZZZ